MHHSRMDTYEQPPAYRLTRKVRTGGNGCTALAVFLLGLVMLFFFWPLGLLLIVIGLLADARYGNKSFCGQCGNEVAPTSNLCPHCSYRLVTPPLSYRLSGARRVLIVMLVLTLIILFLSWLVLPVRP